MRFIAFLLLLAFLLFTAGTRYYYVCGIKGLCDEAPAEAADPRLQTLQLRQGETVILDGYDQFAFDTMAVLPRLNANNAAFLDTVAQILAADTSLYLTITGRYRPAEAGQTYGFFENLGLARADVIRQELGRRGIAEDRIPLDHVRSTDPTLAEPLTFELYVPGDLVEDYAKRAFTFTNMSFSDINFEFDSDVFVPGEPFRFYADSVQTYFEIHPDREMIITGHTDNIGSSQYNLDLGQRRADNVRQYFLDLGLTNEITTRSEGENRPVASNRTDEGRLKNRRVEITLEQ
jgi:outer membrane protein OmpA-like peptidoglycan-associated protein